MQLVHMRESFHELPTFPETVNEVPESVRARNRDFGGMTSEVWYMRAVLAMLSDSNWDILTSAYEEIVEAAFVKGATSVQRIFPWSAVSKAVQTVCR